MMRTVSFGGIYDPGVVQLGTAMTDENGNATITFAPPFASVPKVFVSSSDAETRGIVLDVVAKSKTGFAVKARRTTGITTENAGGHQHNTFGGNSVVNALVGAINKAIRNVENTENALYVAEGPAGIYSIYTDITGTHSHIADAPVGSFSFDWIAILI